MGSRFRLRPDPRLWVFLRASGVAAVRRVAPADLAPVSFNVGVELGQLLVLVVLIPALNLFFRYVVAERVGTILLSALVAHTGWHWATERGWQLMQFPVPALNIAGLTTAIRLLLLMVVAAFLVWILFGVLRRPTASQRQQSEARQ